LGINAPFHRFLQSQLRDWMLYLVDRRGIRTRGELIARASQALDFNAIPAVQVMELAQGQPQADELIERSLAELFQRGWLMEEGQLSVTDAGRKRLERWV